MALGVLTLVMGIGGIRFTIAVHEFFDLHTQHHVAFTRGVLSGPRPWPEPGVLAYLGTATILMSAGSCGLILQRRWGLTLAAFAGEAAVISSSVSLRLISRVGAFRPFFWTRREALAEEVLSSLVLMFGVLLLTLWMYPSWIGFSAVRETGRRRVALTLFGCWGFLSFAASDAFYHWYVGLG